MEFRILIMGNVKNYFYFHLYHYTIITFNFSSMLYFLFSFTLFLWTTLKNSRGEKPDTDFLYALGMKLTSEIKV